MTFSTPEYSTAAAQLGSLGAGVARAAQPLNLTAAADVAGAVSNAATAAADAIDRLLAVDKLPHLFLSYGNAAYFNFVHNWAIGVRQIGAPYVIAGMPPAFPASLNSASFGMPASARQITQANVQRWLADALHVVAAFDDAMLDLCANHSLPCVRAQFTTPANFRGDFAAFRAMGAVKVGCRLLLCLRSWNL